MKYSKRKISQCILLLTWETFFLKNHIQNVMEQLKNQNWAYLSINTLKFYTVCFNSMPSWGISEYIESKPQTTCFYLFQKRKRGLKLVFLPHFLHNFWKIIFLLYSFNSPNFIVWLLLLPKILGNMCIVIVCKSRLWRHKFWN